MLYKYNYINLINLKEYYFSVLLENGFKESKEAKSTK